jgi:hypothetical protein
MTDDLLANKAKTYLQYLSLELPSRSVGTQGNQTATAFFADVVSSFGFHTDTPEFACIDWTQEGVILVIGKERFEAHPSPYTRGCQARAPLAVISSVDELEASPVSGTIDCCVAKSPKGN